MAGGRWQVRGILREGGFGGGVGEAETQVFDVVKGLVEEFRDVLVVEGVDDRAALAGARDQAEVAQKPKLMGAGGLFHADRDDQFGGRAGTFTQVGQDEQP